MGVEQTHGDERAFGVREQRFDPRGRSVLDVGCGTGFFTAWYLSRGAQVTGVDIAPTSIERLRRSFPEARFILSDVSDVALDARRQVEQTLLLSTGIIGTRLPLDRVRAGIGAVVPKLAPTDDALAAAAVPATGFAALSGPVRLVMLTEQTRDWEHGRPEAVFAGLRRYIAGTAALMGIIEAIELRSMQAKEGIGLEFIFIICAVVGGCLLTGGYGSVIGTAFGAAMLGMVQLGIVDAQWDSNWTFTFQGAILFAAVMLNALIRKRAQKAR